MEPLEKIVSNIRVNKENVPVFCSAVLNAEHTELPFRIIRKTEIESKAKCNKNMYLDGLFLKIFAARAYELRGFIFDALNCYERASKIAGFLELYFERGKLLERCAFCYLTLEQPDFKNAGYAFLKAARCFQQNRLKAFRQLNRAEQSFICAENDITQLALYSEILAEIKTGVLDGEYLHRLVKNQNGMNIELLIGEIIFAHESLLEIDRIKRVGKNMKGEVRFTTIAIMRAALARTYELTSLTDNYKSAGIYYEAAAIQLLSNGCIYGRAELFARAAQNYLRANVRKDAARALLLARRDLENEFRREFFERAKCTLSEGELKKVLTTTDKYLKRYDKYYANSPDSLSEPASTEGLEKI